MEICEGDRAYLGRRGWVKMFFFESCDTHNGRLVPEEPKRKCACIEGGSGEGVAMCMGR